MNLNGASKTASDPNRVITKPLYGRPFCQSKKRLRKRQGERREIEFKIQQELQLGYQISETTDGKDGHDAQGFLGARVEMPISFLKELINGIVINRISSFGLVRLSRYQLSTAYPLPSDEVQWPMPSSGWSIASSHMTLMLFAYIWNRDNCIAALLRAGCTPIVMDNPSSQHSDELLRGPIMEVLTRFLQPSVSVWVVKLYYQIRFSNMKVQPCQSLGCKPRDHVKVMLATRLPCQHNFCEECFWTNTILQFRTNKFDDLRCPVCQELISMAGSDASTLPCPCSLVVETVPRADRLHNGELRSSGLTAVIEYQKTQPPELLCKQSLAKYSMLPKSMADAEIEGIEDQVKMKDRPKKLAAMPYSIIVGQFVGTTQSQRNLELIKAAVAGNALRLRALVNAGVNLDFSNEYGQTALFIAAWRGHKECVEVLLECGADPTLDDNAKILPRLVAAASPTSRLTDILAAFDEWGVKSSDVQQELLLPLFTSPALTTHYLNPLSDMSVEVLIDLSAAHPGAGSFYLDNVFREDFLLHLDRLAQILPIAPPEKMCSSDRAYFCDALGRVSDVLVAGVAACLSNHLPSASAMLASPPKVFQHMRYLHYLQVGGSLAPHVDLSRTNEDDQVTSTHTFILYLSNCSQGGATVLLNSVKTKIVSAVKIEGIDDTEIDDMLDTNRAGVLDDIVELLERGSIAGDCRSEAPRGIASAPAAQKWDKADNVDRTVARDENIVATVRPQRGRLLLFPHLCPHAGQIVVDVPKLLLRGEAFLPFSE